MITSLRLQNFRSYIDDSFEFNPGVNIVVGPNGSGKTNLLEAVLVLCGNKSFRTRDINLINEKCKWARLEGNFENSERVLKLTINSEVSKKEFVLNGKEHKRLNFTQTVPVVVFEPNHLQIVARGPDVRREFFDDLLIRTQPTYKQFLNNYNRALTQRNSLLKKRHHVSPDQIFVWDIRLSELGEKVAVARHQLLQQLSSELPEVYSKISGKPATVALRYCAGFAVESYGSRMLARLQQTHSRDAERGFTGCGPHREDIEFIFEDQPALNVASRGETRSIMLALKILELQMIEKARGAQPILLLDDVFSELDGARRRALVDYLADHQTIITTTEADAVIEYFSTGTHNLIPIQKP